VASEDTEKVSPELLEQLAHTGSQTVPRENLVQTDTTDTRSLQQRAYVQQSQLQSSKTMVGSSNTHKYFVTAIIV
jgi:hypothetical protein